MYTKRLTRAQVWPVPRGKTPRALPGDTARRGRAQTQGTRLTERPRNVHRETFMIHETFRRETFSHHPHRTREAAVSCAAQVASMPVWQVHSCTRRASHVTRELSSHEEAWAAGCSTPTGAGAHRENSHHPTPTSTGMKESSALSSSGRRQRAPPLSPSARFIGACVA